MFSNSVPGGKLGGGKAPASRFDFAFWTQGGSQAADFANEGFWPRESGCSVAHTDASFFFGHLLMMGGMLFVVAFGAGAYSVEN